MDIRYSTNPKDFKTYTTEDIRREFLIETLFRPDEVIATYSHVDRMVAVGCMPVHEVVPIDKGIDCWGNFGTHYFLERREIGIFNVGTGTGKIVADGQTYNMGPKDCLYITMGTKEVTFASDDPENPAKYYMVSAPAHKACKTQFISIKDANKSPCGEVALANKRVINQFIHPDVVETCQLCMGLTALDEGSVWNSMPPHTHERRMEIYFYFEVPENQAVFHIMGQEQETRHIVMHNEQAVISPSWSMHCGCGTHNYTFIWAMGGENKEFDDMDHIEIKNMK